MVVLDLEDLHRLVVGDGAANIVAGRLKLDHLVNAHVVKVVGGQRLEATVENDGVPALQADQIANLAQGEHAEDGLIEDLCRLCSWLVRRPKFQALILAGAQETARIDWFNANYGELVLEVEILRCAP